MSESEKEALRKEFERDYCEHPENSGQLIVSSSPESVFDFLVSKLEEKDKQIEDIRINFKDFYEPKLK